MTNLAHDNLVQELGTLGRGAVLSITQRQRIRDRLFKKIGQTVLIDAVQTHTEVGDMVVPLRQLQSLFRPQRMGLGVPATAGVVIAVFLLTFTTSALAKDARPGDALFGVRKVVEGVQIALTTDLAKKAALQLAIADNRLQDLQTVDGKNLDAILQESKQALVSAQSTITALQKTSDDQTSADLVNKLATLIDDQKSTLTIIINGSQGNADIRKSVLAMRDTLDTLLPVNNSATTAAPATGATNATAPVSNDARTHFYGTLTMSHGQLALLDASNNKIYLLSGITLDLASSVGAGLEVFGVLQGETIFVSQLYLNNKLIWDNTPDKDNNNLSRVEGDQNTSPR